MFSLFILTLSLSLAFVLTFTWWRIDVILAHTCLCPILSVSFFLVLSPALSLSSVTLFSTLLAVARVLPLDCFFLFLSLSITFSLCRVLSHSPLSLSLSLSFSLTRSFFLLYLFVSLPLAHTHYFSGFAEGALGGDCESSVVGQGKFSSLRYCLKKNPPKWQENNLVSGGHGQAGSLRGP